MSKPSIGNAVTTVLEEKKQEIKELTVLNEDSKQSIYYYIFVKSEESNKNE